jgi:hypothetical protein
LFALGRFKGMSVDDFLGAEFMGEDEDEVRCIWLFEILCF